MIKCYTKRHFAYLLTYDKTEIWSSTTVLAHENGFRTKIVTLASALKRALALILKTTGLGFDALASTPVTHP